MTHTHTRQNTKVLFVITKSNFGGAQRYVYDLATHLPDGYEAVVALGGTGAQGAETGSLKTELEKAGVRTRVIPHFMRDMSLLDDVHAFFELWRVIRTERPHVLHVTSSKAGGLGAFAGRLHNMFAFFARGQTPSTIIFTSHGLTFDEIWRPWWQRALIYCFTWLTIFLSTRTIQISTDTYTRAHRMPLVGSKVRLVHNGIDAPDFLSRDEARKKLLPSSPNSVFESRWVGTIAEYHPNKNLSVLIEAMALLNEQGIHTQLLLIGEGEERTMLEALARERGVSEQVHLVGYVHGAARYLPALDIFTLPSKKEGLPYVLLEAGYAGLPCVVSNITGNTDIIEQDKTGLVVEATAERFATAFKTLREAPTQAHQYARALHEDVTTRFSVERMVVDTVALYVREP